MKRLGLGAYLTIMLTASAGAQQVSSDEAVNGQFRAIISPDGRTTEYVTAESEGSLSSLLQGLERFSDEHVQVFQVENQHGEFQGYVLTDNPQARIFDSVLTRGWEAIPYTSIDTKNLMTASISLPVPEAEFMRNLGNNMLDQAIQLACDSRIRPINISVSASLAASVGFIVGGEGTIEFAATWETAEICP